MSDEGEWGARWEVQGTRGDGTTASIRIGVVEVDGYDSVAISVDGEPAVTVTDHVATEAAELLGWAMEERALLADRRRQEESDPLKDSLDRAILTHQQWDTLCRALARSGERATADVALTVLRAAAPSTWTDRRDEDDDLT